ncbi:uncharacterized protein LOC128238164 isoform X2 [Mya arenaria]|uniref:uncharacterized protein LOC128238164 isoform X2 n=1 Tax=Mya arenaria TaxID=6604 RepID=UPI0022E7B61B|nr:uncharacterized protein LOC128238164 isoform X2 [Mya arenaria]
MEVKPIAIITTFVACIMLVQSLAIPAQSEDNGLSADKRPKYMDTRDLSYFKDLMLVAIDELIDEGIINPDILAKPEPATEVPMTENKRAVLKLCIRRNQQGGFVAKPCWKSSGRH